MTVRRNAKVEKSTIESTAKKKMEWKEKSKIQSIWDKAIDTKDRQGRFNIC